MQKDNPNQEEFQICLSKNKIFIYEHIPSQPHKFIKNVKCFKALALLRIKVACSLGLSGNL